MVSGLPGDRMGCFIHYVSLIDSRLVIFRMDIMSLCDFTWLLVVSRIKSGTFTFDLYFHCDSKLCIDLSSLNLLPFSLSLANFLHLRLLSFFSQWLSCSCSKWISRKFDTSTGHCALLNAHLLLAAVLPAFVWARRGTDWYGHWRWVNLNLCIFIWQWKSRIAPRPSHPVT